MSLTRCMRTATNSEMQLSQCHSTTDGSWYIRCSSSTTRCYDALEQLLVLQVQYEKGTVVTRYGYLPYRTVDEKYRQSKVVPRLCPDFEVNKSK